MGTAGRSPLTSRWLRKPRSAQAAAIAAVWALCKPPQVTCRWINLNVASGPRCETRGAAHGGRFGLRKKGISHPRDRLWKLSRERLPGSAIYQ